ncbi:DUF3793 family protein [Thermophilibacter provencensis]|uniref:DUF3793 family protein n=1 Tax=Thermophilibacter provencensis TaxID=1852386 RepID=A0ABT7V3V0_9ACTN|nr:DUF3793 family protein [Thermophilibacter provencensis]MDM8271268.1 DUF3793 family protein [Thermophilibacter provencensis]
MGQGMDSSAVGLGMAATPEELLEAQLVRCLVCQAGLVMAGRKPAAVFGFRPRTTDATDTAGAAARTADATRAAVAAPREPSTPHPRRLVARLLSVYAGQTRPLGLRISCLGWRGERVMLLVWRPELVEVLLAEREVRRFLARRGLPGDPASLVSRLAGLLRSYYAGRRPFPHEVGIVLGYPVEDVEGFLADGGRNAAACGRWKVYGDVRAARRRFEELDRADSHVKRLFSAGVPMRELLRMGAA